MARIENFNPSDYGGEGIGMADINELKNRGHGYQEINDLVNAHRGKRNIGEGAEIYLAEQGREFEKQQAKKAESKERAQNYINENKREKQDYSGDFTGGKRAEMEGKFGGGKKYERKQEFMNKQYDFDYKT